MGMDLTAYAFRQADEEWLAKKAILEDCLKNSTKIPADIAELFDVQNYDPDSSEPDKDAYADDIFSCGQLIDIGCCVKECPIQEMESQHILIDIEKLPPGVKKILVRYW